MTADTFTGRRQGLQQVQLALLAMVRRQQEQAHQRRLALFRIRCAIAEVRDVKEAVQQLEDDEFYTEAMAW